MKITRVNHISINVDGGAYSGVMDFFSGILGLPVINDVRPQQFKDAIPGDWFSIGDARLHVFDYEEGQELRQPGSPQPGGPHFAVYVEDLSGAVAELESRDIPYWSNGEGVKRQVWVLDPGGNTVELSQDPDTYNG